MKRAGLAILFLVELLLSVPAVFACQFQYDPVSTPRYYRAQGWSPPGTTDFDAAAVQTHQLPTAESIPGAATQVLPRESPYVVVFPAQEFLLKGARQRMRAAQVQVSISRWVMHRRTVAYSYSLTPVMAHRADGKWIVDAMAACIYFATFIDDKGDGVFRILVPDRFTAEFVPLWAKPGKN